MHDEIFGPIMPVMTVKDEQAAIDVMHLHEKPLALYMFGKDREVFDRWVDRWVDRDIYVV